MKKNCNGSYKIISEGPKGEGGVVANVSSSTAVLVTSNYWYITYECLD